MVELTRVIFFLCYKDFSNIKLIFILFLKEVEVQKQQKDLAYFKRWSARMDVKLGWKANKLQKHFRRQDICF